MLFKKLALLGLKSFGHKTVPFFQAGFTIVVGPNECGKYNVIETARRSRSLDVGTSAARRLAVQRSRSSGRSGSSIEKTPLGKGWGKSYGWLGFQGEL